jgi:hypothetical protein
MQSDRHVFVIARDPRDSKALFAQSSRRVDFSHRGWNVLRRQWILPGQAGRCRGVLPPAAQVGLLLLARLVEDRHGG